MNFEEFVARKDAERAARARTRVTWRRVSPDTGGGWSGLGPEGRLVFARLAEPHGWEYGTVEGRSRVVAGLEHHLRDAKLAAERLVTS